MVLFKRKPIEYVTKPLPEDDTTDVWLIPHTKEWFTTYDGYLERLDFYRKRQFVCEITGNSQLTYFEAMELETREIEALERNFPDALREHILRFLQFNRITRLDLLIDKVYLEFKHDYFPGELVYLKVKGLAALDAKRRAVVLEKVQIGGDVPVTRYLVRRLQDNVPTQVTAENILRERNQFTKWLIKTFIKLTVSRSSRVGAPWVVKDYYAKKYRIPQTYPEDLLQYAEDHAEEPVAKKKLHKKKDPLEQVATAPLARKLPRPADMVLQEDTVLDPMAEPRPRGKRFQLGNIDLSETLRIWLFINIFHLALHLDAITFDDFVIALRWSLPQFKEFGNCVLLDELFCALLGAIISNEDRKNKGLLVTIPEIENDDDNDENMDEDNDEEDNEPEENGTENGKANGSKTTKKANGTAHDDHDDDDDVEIQREVVDIAASSEVEEEEEDDEEDVEVTTRTGRKRGRPPKNSPRKNLRVTPSSPSPTPTPAPEATTDDDNDDVDHYAFRAMNTKGQWYDKIHKRQFRDGQWQCGVIGVLSEVKDLPQYADVCLEVFHKLAPKLEGTPTPSRVLERWYRDVDPGLRVKILAIFIDLLCTGQVVRARLEFCSEEGTLLRRQRIDVTKETKALLEEASKVWDQLVAKVPRPDKFSHLPTNILEAEEELAKTDKEFAGLLKQRQEMFAKVKQLRATKHSLEKRIMELDCQRAEILGKDRFYNRYWWFENSAATADQDDPEDKDDVGHDDEFLEETYLMGTLWVQGPSQGDLEKYGGVLASVKGEGNTDDLVDGNLWEYYDDPEDIARLLKWLNSLGYREHQLKRELALIAEQLRAAMTARKLALAGPYDKYSEQLRRVEETLNEIKNTVHVIDDDDDNEQEDDEVTVTRRQSRRQAKDDPIDVDDDSYEDHDANSDDDDDDDDEDGDEIDIEAAIKNKRSDELEQAKSFLQERLDEDREVARVMEWVNSAAVDKYGKSLYEGGDKPVLKTRKKTTRKKT